VPSEVVDPATAYDSGASLAAVVGRLHPAVLDVLVAPRGLDVPAGDPVILDPAEEPQPPAGAIVLAVGMDTLHSRIALLHRLAGSDVAAVVVKHTGPADPALLAAADQAGAAVLGAPPALAWGQLFTLLVTATGPVSNAAGIAEAPLGDLFALANAVAAMVGGATTIEDTQSRVLAYSNLEHPTDLPRRETILGRQVPSEWLRRLHDAGVFRRLWQTEEVVHVDGTVVDEPGYLNRIAVAVRAGGELLGSIWVIEGEQPLGPDAEHALREAAGIAALHLLRHRSAQDVDRRRRADSLLSVLEGHGVTDADRALLGLDRVGAASVVAFDAGAGPDAEGVITAQRIADLVAVYCESYRRQATCAVSGSRVYALVPGEGAGHREQVTTLAHAIVERAGQALHTGVRAGIGGPAAVDGISGARREADQVVDVLDERAAVASADDVRPKIVLHSLRRLADAHAELRAGRLGALVEQDATKGTAWIATLRAYFDAFGDMAAASARVNVHPNTFRYRLRRITEVFGLDLDDPDERLALELQLRFLD
jgi:hypothetical protein